MPSLKRLTLKIILLLAFNILPALNYAQTIDANQIAQYVKQYSQQGSHITGSHVDKVTAVWMEGILKRQGYEVKLAPVAIKKVTLKNNIIKLDKKIIHGFPVYDGNFTKQNGISGKLGLPGTDADIVVLEMPVSVKYDGNKLFTQLRYGKKYRAIVALTQGNKPGLALIDNENYPLQKGLPILQVSNVNNATLMQLAKEQARATFIAYNTIANSTAYNVIATLPGKNEHASPVLFTVPRSAWTPAAEEHGTAVACWLAMANVFSKTKPEHPLIFIAFTGHEIGYLGFNQLMKDEPSYFKRSSAWFHFGTNIGSSPPLTLGSNTTSYAKLAQKVAADNMTDLHMIDSMYGEPQNAIQTFKLMMPIFSIFTENNSYFHMNQDRWQNVKSSNVAHNCEFYIKFAKNFIE